MEKQIKLPQAWMAFSLKISQNKLYMDEIILDNLLETILISFWYELTWYLEHFQYNIQKVHLLKLDCKRRSLDINRTRIIRKKLLGKKSSLTARLETMKTPPYCCQQNDYANFMNLLWRWLIWEVRTLM